MREQAVFRIALGRPFGDITGTLVGVRGHDEPWSALMLHTSLDKAARQPVEQCRVRRPRAHLPKLLAFPASLDRSVLPDPVRHHSRRERIA